MVVVRFGEGFVGGVIVDDRSRDRRVRVGVRVERLRGRDGEQQQRQQQRRRQARAHGASVAREAARAVLLAPAPLLKPGHAPLDAVFDISGVLGRRGLMLPP